MVDPSPTEQRQTVKEVLGLITTVLLTAGLLADIIIYSQPGSTFPVLVATLILFGPAVLPWAAFPYLVRRVAGGTPTMRSEDSSGDDGTRCRRPGAKPSSLKRPALIAVAVLLAALGGIGLALSILAENTQ